MRLDACERGDRHRDERERHADADEQVAGQQIGRRRAVHRDLRVPEHPAGDQREPDRHHRARPDPRDERLRDARRPARPCRLSRGTSGRSSAPSSASTCCTYSVSRKKFANTTAPSRNPADVRAGHGLHAEDAERHHRRRAAASRSRRTRRAARLRRSGADRAAAAPADLRRLRDRVDEQREARRDRDRAGRVEAAQPGMRLSRTTGARQQEHERRRPGTLTKKIHSQPAYFVRMPPKSTPAAAPLPPIAPQMPSALLRSEPSSNVVVMIDERRGRDDRRSDALHRARRDQHADRVRRARRRATRPENSAMPIMNIRRRPSRSAARPPSSSRPPNVIV